MLIPEDVSTLVRQTVEIDPYDMYIAPMNIYEYLVLPISIHNLSNSFRPNFATIQVYHQVQNLYLKGYSKKEIKRFLYLKIFLEGMDNEVYFMETKPDV